MNSSGCVYVIENGPLPPAINMAVDEYLFRTRGQQLFTAESVILRIYSWDRPAWTIGYFQDFPHSLASSGTVVRRITGGGIVDHRQDLTFSLVFQLTHPLFGSRDRERSYRAINEIICDALKTCGQHSELCETPPEPDAPARIRQCFSNPVRYDVVSHGIKLCGGAQRRDRRWILHQGSIDLTHLSAISKDRLKDAFISVFPADEFIPIELDDKAWQEIDTLAEGKYTRECWNIERHRPPIC